MVIICYTGNVSFDVYSEFGLIIGIWKVSYTQFRGRKIKNKRVLFLIALTTVLMMSVGFTFASDGNTNTVRSIILPDAISHCPYGGDHAMESNGHIVLKDKNNDSIYYRGSIFGGGNLFICEKCGDKIITEGSPHREDQPLPLWRYIYGEDFKIVGNMWDGAIAQTYYSGSTGCHYTNSTTLEGYDFLLHRAFMMELDELK